MRILLRSFMVFLLHLSLGSTAGQGLNLLMGENYRISQSLSQNTLSDSPDVRGNASLDLFFSLLVNVKGTTDSGDYLLECRYEELSLSLFSPDMNMAFSSENGSYTLLKKYLAQLEEFHFSLLASPEGAIMAIPGLDSGIQFLCNSSVGNSGEQEILIKTIREAFGEDALAGALNLALNVHCNSLQNECIREVIYSFNARPVMISNRLFYQSPREGDLLVQGIGLIETTGNEMVFDGGKVSTTLQGNQTYDYLLDSTTGWIRKGHSRQKIFMVTTFAGNPNMPEGLQIPSVTESEFSFKGEKISEN